MSKGGLANNDIWNVKKRLVRRLWTIREELKQLPTHTSNSAFECWLAIKLFPRWRDPGSHLCLNHSFPFLQFFQLHRSYCFSNKTLEYNNHTLDICKMISRHDSPPFGLNDCSSSRIPFISQHFHHLSRCVYPGEGLDDNQIWKTKSNCEVNTSNAE